MNVYTAWTNRRRNSFSFVAGEGRPRFLNGKELPDCEILLWRIEAATWEEASAIHHLRMGDGGYQVNGLAKHCPKCGSMYYPKGSGECWQCGKIC